MQPPWWFTVTLGPSVAVLLGGFMLMSRSHVRFSDPWFALGWGLCVGGGGWGLLTFLFYRRWIGRTFPVRLPNDQIQRLSRRQLDVMQVQEPRYLTTLYDLNAHLRPWHLGGIEPPKP